MGCFSLVGGLSARVVCGGLPRCRRPWCSSFSRWFLCGPAGLGRGACARVRSRWWSLVSLLAFQLKIAYNIGTKLLGLVMFSSSVSSSVLGLVSGAGCVGFSGGRSLSGSSLSAAQWLAGSSSVSSGFVGCAAGADALFRGAFPGLRVVSVAPGSGRGGFAQRSVSVVLGVSRSGSGLWVSFPSGPCPAGLVPSSSSSRCFCGLGSGSWASLALAAGLGVSCLVFLPSGSVPASWDFVALGGGWFSFSPSSSGSAQLALF